MIFPVVFTSLIYRFTDSFTVNWSNYINSLHLFYGIFLGALIPSFVAIFAVYYELKSGTIKNLITSPYSRVKIVITSYSIHYTKLYEKLFESIRRSSASSSTTAVAVLGIRSMIVISPKKSPFSMTAKISSFPP